MSVLRLVFEKFLYNFRTIIMTVVRSYRYDATVKFHMAENVVRMNFWTLMVLNYKKKLLWQDLLEIEFRKA